MTLELADKLFVDRKYFSAIEKYLAIVDEQKSLNYSEQTIHSLRKVISSYEKLDEFTKARNFHIKLADYFFDKGQLILSRDELIQITEYDRTSASIYYKLWNVTRLLGEIEQCSLWSKSYIKIMDCFNNQSAIKKFILEIKSNSLPLSSFEKEALLRSYILLGEYKEVFNTSKENELLDLNDFKRDEKFWKNHDLYNLLVSNDLDARKACLLAIYELLLSEDHSKALISLNKYTKAYQAKTLGEALFENDIKVDYSKWQNDLVEDNIFDFGTDLINSKTRDDIYFLADRINYLIGNQEEQQALELIEKLKKIAPNHTLVKILHEKSYQRRGSKFQSVLKNKSSYLYQDGQKEQSFTQMIGTLDKESLEKDAERYISYLMQIDMHEVALEVLSKVKDNWKEDGEKSLNWSYLYSECQYMLKDFYKCICEIDQVLENSPVIENDLLCFLFLRAESYESLGNIKEALLSYRHIFNIDSSYRGVESRMKVIEES